MPSRQKNNTSAITSFKVIRHFVFCLNENHWWPFSLNVPWFEGVWTGAIWQVENTLCSNMMNIFSALGKKLMQKKNDNKTSALWAWCDLWPWVTFPPSGLFSSHFLSVLCSSSQIILTEAQKKTKHWRGVMFVVFWHWRWLYPKLCWIAGWRIITATVRITDLLCLNDERFCFQLLKEQAEQIQQDSIYFLKSYEFNPLKAFLLIGWNKIHKLVIK